MGSGMSTTHVVRRGECLSIIARRYGFGDYKVIYDHPDNASFKQKRPNPNVIFPGDTVVIPDKQTKQHAVPSGKKTRFKTKVPKKVLRLRLVDGQGAAIANEPYTFELSGLARRDGTTTGDGDLEQKIPTGYARAELCILGRTLTLELGNLNPMKDAPDRGVSGAQGRLQNLGYPVGALDGVLGRRTHTAVALFQAAEQLDVNADLDARTIAALEQKHGC
jgi:Putative peptidoglycan binding domain